MAWSVRDLTFRYTASAAPVLRGVSLDVPAGACTAIVGPNGSGKSTLFHLLLGLERPDCGEIRFAGRPMAAWSRRSFARAVGVVPQRESFTFPLTVRQLVALGRYPHLGAWQRERAADAQAIDRALVECDLVALAGRPLALLSGGELQRARLARALAQGTQALALDEPTAALDVAHEMAIFELLRSAAERGTTVLLVTHQINLAARYAHHLVLLEGGRVVATGAPAEVLTRETAERVIDWPVRIAAHPGPGPDRGAPQLVPLARRGGSARAGRALAALLSVLLALVLPRALRAQFPPEVVGRVLAAGTAAPVQGAIIDVPGSVVRAVSDAEGRFALRGVEPGEIELRVRAVGYAPARVTVHAANGRTTAVTVTLTPVPTRLAPVEVRGAGRQTPAGAVVIDRAAIAASGARDLGDLLGGRAGLVVTRRGGPGAPATLAVRGSSDGEVLVLVDGTPINDPLTGAADLSSLPPALIERVTVLRGAQSARYGARALAGVVLVELREPARTEMTARLEAGAWGERSAMLSLGGTTPMSAGARARLSALISGEWRATDGTFRVTLPAVRGGGEAVRRNADARHAGLVAAVALERAGDELRVRGELADAARGMPGPIAQPSLTARQGERRSGLVLSAHRERERWSLHADLAVQAERMRFRDSTPPFGSPYDDRARASSAGGTVTARRRLGALELGAGVEGRRIRLEATALTSAAPHTQWTAGGWLMGRLTRPLPALGGEGTEAELTAQARLDDGSNLAGPVGSPRLGLALTRPVGGTGLLRLHLAGGRAFSPPSLADQFFHEGVLARANPGLRPERVRGEVEAGLTLESVHVPGAELDAELTAYRADISDMIQWLPDFRFVWSPSNIAARRRGWEATLHAALRPLHATLQGSVGEAIVEYAGPVLDGQVPYRPRFTASAEFAALVAGVRTTVAAQWIGRRRTVPGSALNTLPGTSRVDLRLSRTLPLPPWTLAAGVAVENVLDRRTELLIDYPAPGRTWRLALTLERGARVGQPGEAHTTP